MVLAIPAVLTASVTAAEATQLFITGVTAGTTAVAVIKKRK